jgi:hypothetical protein
VGIVHTPDFAEANIFVVELLADLVHSLIAALPDGILKLHLQDEVAAAFQIEAELDAIREVQFHLSQRGGKRGQADDAVNTDEQHNQDENKLPLELGIHAGR